MNTKSLESFKRVATGIVMILMPMVWVYGFASHPNLLSLEIVTFEGWLTEFRGNVTWQWAHAGVFLTAPLTVVIALRLMELLRGRADGLALIGGSLTVFGALMLAGDKGALWAAVSAIDTLPDAQFTASLPALQTLWDGKAWMWMFRTVPLYLALIVGFLILGIGLYRTRVVPRWQSASIIVGSLLFFNPDIDLISMIASIFLLLGLGGIGLQTIKGARASQDVASAFSNTTGQAAVQTE